MPQGVPSLPSSSTVHQKILGPAPRGRPVVIPPKNLKLSQDKGQPVGYRLLWQKMKPEALQRGEDMMGLGATMPENLKPKALSYVNARKHRREHL